MSAGQRLLAYDPNQVKPGWIAFLLVLFLILATFLLWRSMNTQLNRIQVPRSSSARPRLGDAEDRVDEQQGSGGDAPDDPPDRA